MYGTHLPVCVSTVPVWSSVRLYARLLVCPSTSASLRESVRLYVGSSVRASTVDSSLFQSARLSLYPSARLSDYTSARQSVCLSARLAVRLSCVYMYLFNRTAWCALSTYSLDVCSFM